VRRRRGARAGRQQGQGASKGKLERWGSGGVTRGQGRAGGWTTAAKGGVLRRRQEEPETEQRRQWRQEEEGEELNQGLICEFREKQGPYCKGLATFKPVLK
jgi:hypothetical protein